MVDRGWCGRPTLQSALKDLGYQFGRATEHLTARRATPFERDTLELEAASTVDGQYSPELGGEARGGCWR